MWSKFLSLFFMSLRELNRLNTKWSSCWWQEQRHWELTKTKKVDCTLQEKIAQLPAVDMQKFQGSLRCYSSLSPRLIQPSFDAQSLCTLQSDCTKQSTHEKDGVWMAAWLEHAASQLQEVEQVLFCSAGEKE